MRSNQTRRPNTQYFQSCERARPACRCHGDRGRSGSSSAALRVKVGVVLESRRAFQIRSSVSRVINTRKGQNVHFITLEWAEIQVQLKISLSFLPLKPTEADTLRNTLNRCFTAMESVRERLKSTRLRSLTCQFYCSPVIVFHWL